MIRLILAAMAALLMTPLAAAADSASDQSDAIVLALLEASASQDAAKTPSAQNPDIGESVPETVLRPKPRPDNLMGYHDMLSMPLTLKGASELTCLAVTLYHEARSDGAEGMNAVATVVLNRVRTRHLWGNSICSVTIPVQFSYLNDDYSFAPILEYEAWRKALEIATVAMVEGPDPWLEGANHYHTFDSSPWWKEKLPMVTQVGSHLFYADPRAAG